MGRRPRGSLLAGVVLAGAIGCSGTDAPVGGTGDSAADETVADAGAQRPGRLDLTFEDPPFGTGAAEGVRFATDLSCGDDPANAFDIALPTGDEPMPLVVFVHGGGFHTGDKADYWSGRLPEGADVPAYLSAGVAVASINHRLLTEGDEDGIRKPLNDVARCLQHLRYHADSTFGVDPDRVALIGRSTGGGAALWLGLHDDLANPVDADPVARMSTRPQAVAVRQAQATYDLARWGDVVFPDYADELDGDLLELAVATRHGDRLLAFYGVSSLAELNLPEIAEYRAEVDLLALMDADDVPFWVANVETAARLPLTPQVFLHHPFHARTLDERAAEVGLEAAVTWGEGLAPAPTQVDYVLDALGVSH